MLVDLGLFFKGFLCCCQKAVLGYELQLYIHKKHELYFFVSGFFFWWFFFLIIYLVGGFCGGVVIVISFFNQK